LGNQRFSPEWGNYKPDQLPNLCTIKGDKIMFSKKLGKIDKEHQVASSEPRLSTNMKNSSLKKKEKLVVWILATKFHTNPTEEPKVDKEFRLNPIMKDLMINGYIDEHHTRAVKRKRRKRQKIEVKDEVVESIGESQPAWIDTLKQEITNRKELSG
jgi:hypothetical protein